MPPRNRAPGLVSYPTIDQTSYQQLSSQESAERSPSVEKNFRKRPPLQHAACIDQTDSMDFPFNGRSRSVVQFRSRSASLDRRNGDHDETPETPSFGKSEESDDRATVRSGLSFDIDANLYPEVFVKKSMEMETVSEFETFGEKMESLYERNSKNRTCEYFYDRPGPSSTDDDIYYRTDENIYSADINDPLQIQRMSVTALFEKFCADEREINRRPQPIRQASETCFRTNRLKGISSDRIGGMFIKKNRNDRMSTSSLGDQPGSGSCFSIFDKRKGKLGRLEKSKRLSTSALYDQSPTGNQIKSGRTSRTSRSTEERLFKNYNSEEFKAEQFYDQINAPSTSKSENFVSKFRFDENPLERASVAKLYEKFCNDDVKSSSIETSQSTPGHIPEERQLSDTTTTSSSKPELFSAASLSEKTSDIMSSTIKSNIDNVFSFNVPDTVDTNGDNTETEPSNTMQLIFEDPRSNRTSVSDIYEPCFSISLTPRQPSFKRESLKGNWMDNLEFRAIDDESPTTSKFTSVSSPNTDIDNSDLFITPDYQFSFSINGDTLPTLADIHEGDSTEENSLSESSITKNQLVPSKSMSSRSSMQKLQPIVLNKRDDSDKDIESIPMENLTLNNKNCTELNDGKNKNYQVFRIRKVNKHDDSTTVKRTRCFPL